MKYRCCAWSAVAVATTFPRKIIIMISSLPSSSLSLSLSLILLPSSLLSSSTVQFPERRKLFTLFSLISFLCSGTVGNQLNSGTAVQIPGIIGQNLGTAAQVPSAVAQNLDSVVQQHQQQQQQQQKKECPENTFRCGDGSCIPQDWVGDGEGDCHDSSDEWTRPTTLFMNPSTGSTTILGGGTGRTNIAEEAFEDPFDQIATVAPSDGMSVSISPLPRTDSAAVAAESIKSLTRSDTFLRRTNDLKGCLNFVQTRVDQCSTDLTDWLEKLDQIDLTNSSMLNDATRWRVLDHGCELLLEFRTCTETLNITACVLPKSIQLWNNIELYVCQLLLPSIKEYKSCFANAQNPQCLLTADAGQDEAPPICRILTSVRSDLRCVQRNARNGCTASALEVIGPLESETDHMYTQLTCAYITSVASSGVATARASSTSTDPAGINELEDKRVPYDVLYMFNTAHEICAKSANPQWVPLHRAVCTNREKLIQQRQCFINASSLVQCNQKPLNETICDAMQQFSNNIDCALRVMNDVCTVDAQNVAVAVQDALNDDLIINRCYVEAITEILPADEEFILNPKNAKCSSEQENLALACLVDLVEVNKKIAELQSLNFLHEISERNSSLISGICNLYQKYESCVRNMVFVHSSGQRCAFNSPLNTLARIGLSPICDQRTRVLLQKNNDCIQKIKHRTSVCQSGLHGLGTAIHNMLQGIHAEAHLCNLYYLIREAFDCGEKIFAEMCTTEAVLDLRQIQQLMTDLGTEEGCPIERPGNLQEIISRPVAAATARPFPKIKSGHTEPTVASCDPEEQKRFATCIQPITAFQPHPLAVIKQPKQIDEACKQFNEFMKCQTNVGCFPLWAKGMSSMFEFACGSGYNTYIQVRQCIRKATTREDIRECVSEFSRGAPQLACQSSNKLLSCAVPIINEKCGQPGAKFVTDYIDKFATAIDPTCKVGIQQNDRAIIGYNCTADQTTLIDHCAAPINELSSRIDELFEGGLQQFLTNVKNLAPVFAQGCNLTSEFRQCVKPILEQNSQQCVVSSCLIRAGDGICDRPDTAKAIDDNLACVFKQASELEFGKCLRSTIATLKQFNLAALRSILPQFVNCVEHIVVQRCGQTPINVLRAISTTEMCPIGTDSEPASDLGVPQICNAQMQQKHLECVGNFYRNYRMLPIALLNDPSSIDMLCDEASKLTACSYPVCEANRHRALKALADFVCIRRDTYKKHSLCLASVATSSEGSKCLATFLTTAPERQCLSLTNAANCAAPHVNSACGYEALTLAFEGMHTFAKELNDSCNIQIPVAAVKTSCSESDIVEYLECENLIDRFSFTPLSFIRNSSLWSHFCEAANSYESCLANISCRVEPVSSANAALFRTICGEEETNTRTYLPCLTQFVSTDTGKSCSQPFASLDLLAKDIPHTICSSMKNLLFCASPELSSQCTEQALKHVTKMLSLWVRKFDSNCSISGFDIIKNAKPEKELSLDSNPTYIAIDQTVSPFNLTATPRIPLIITASVIPELEPAPEPEPATGFSLSSVPGSPTGGSIRTPEHGPTAEPEPESTRSSDTEPEFAPKWREGSSSTSASVPGSNPEPANTESTSLDSVSAAQPSPEPEPNAIDETASNLNPRTQGSKQMHGTLSGFWILLIATLSVTLSVQHWC